MQPYVDSTVNWVNENRNFNIFLEHLTIYLPHAAASNAASVNVNGPSIYLVANSKAGQFIELSNYFYWR